MAVSNQVGAGRRTQGLWKSSKCSYPLSLFSSPHPYFTKQFGGAYGVTQALLTAGDPHENTCFGKPHLIVYRSLANCMNNQAVFEVCGNVCLDSPSPIPPPEHSWGVTHHSPKLDPAMTYYADLERNQRKCQSDFRSRRTTGQTSSLSQVRLSLAGNHSRKCAFYAGKTPRF